MALTNKAKVFFAEGLSLQFLPGFCFPPSYLASIHPHFYHHNVTPPPLSIGGPLEVYGNRPGFSVQRQACCSTLLVRIQRREGEEK